MMNTHAATAFLRNRRSRRSTLVASWRRLRIRTRTAHEYKCSEETTTESDLQPTHVTVIAKQAASCRWPHRQHAWKAAHQVGGDRSPEPTRAHRSALCVAQNCTDGRSRRQLARRRQGRTDVHEPAEHKHADSGIPDPRSWSMEEQRADSQGRNTKESGSLIQARCRDARKLRRNAAVPELPEPRNAVRIESMPTPKGLFGLGQVREKGQQVGTDHGPSKRVPKTRGCSR